MDRSDALLVTGILVVAWFLGIDALILEGTKRAIRWLAGKLRGSS